MTALIVGMALYLIAGIATAVLAFRGRRRGDAGIGSALACLILWPVVAAMAASFAVAEAVCEWIVREAAPMDDEPRERP